MTFTMNARRLLIFISIVVVIGLALQQLWARKAPTEKWLYLNDYPARQYANKVLGPARGTDVPLPEELSSHTVEVHDKYVVFTTTRLSPPLTMAFAPVEKPPPPDRVSDWAMLGDGWYVLKRGAAAERGTNQ
jgi:hypothetical protein